MMDEQNEIYGKCVVCATKITVYVKNIELLLVCTYCSSKHDVLAPIPASEFWGASMRAPLMRSE